jgi:predicted DNA-binding transcriptional regulator AlpA
MSQHLVGLAEVAQFLGIVSRGKRPGNRLWELMRAGRLKQFPHVRIGRTYRFNLADVEAWVGRQAGGGFDTLARSR